MKCIFCGSETRVTDKRESPKGTRRRRECLKCKKRFTSYERPEQKEIMVIKKDGRKELFSREKLKAGITRACEKRPISIEKIDKIVDNIKEKLKKEVKSEKIGKIIINKLRKLDSVAYIRFASVYRDFQDIKDFKKEIKELKNGKAH